MQGLSSKEDELLEDGLIVELYEARTNTIRQAFSFREEIVIWVRKKIYAPVIRINPRTEAEEVFKKYKV